MMPSRYTSQMSKDDALAQARALGVQISSLPIEGTVRGGLERAWPPSSRAAHRTPPRKNIQATCAVACC